MHPALCWDKTEPPHEMKVLYLGLNVALFMHFVLHLQQLRDGHLILVWKEERHKEIACAGRSLARCRLHCDW